MMRLHQGITYLMPAILARNLWVWRSKQVSTMTCLLKHQ